MRRSQTDPKARPFAGGEPEQHGGAVVVAESVDGDRQERSDVHRQREASIVALRRADDDAQPLHRRGRIAAGELDGGADDVDALDVGPVVVDVRFAGERERFGVAAERAEGFAA